jgi:hypothetical protein
MNKIFPLAIFAVFFLALALQSVSAYASYNYYPNSGYGEFSLSFHDKNHENYNYYGSNHDGYYWDNEDLKWRKDPVQEWINNGDGWREQVKRARAVNFLVTSWDERYAMASGKTTGEVFSYNDGATDTKAESSTNWRYKEAYDPLVHGVDSYKNYYYEPRYDSQTQTYNWRY